MDPVATIREFAKTTSKERDRRNELATAYQEWLDRGGFLPRVRHRNDGPDGRTAKVTGLYARGVHTYLLTPDAEAPLLASEYEIVATICPDCGEEGERKGHQTCQYPQD